MAMELWAVGTGPLEDLVNDHGDVLVDEIEQAARQAPEFASALGSVSVEQGALRHETLQRLARWTGTLNPVRYLRHVRMSLAA